MFSLLSSVHVFSLVLSPCFSLALSPQSSVHVLCLVSSSGKDIKRWGASLQRMFPSNPFTICKTAKSTWHEDQGKEEEEESRHNETKLKYSEVVDNEVSEMNSKVDNEAKKNKFGVCIDDKYGGVYGACNEGTFVKEVSSAPEQLVKAHEEVAQQMVLVTRDSLTEEMVLVTQDSLTEEGCVENGLAEHDQNLPSKHVPTQAKSKFYLGDPESSELEDNCGILLEVITESEVEDDHDIDSKDKHSSKFYLPRIYPDVQNCYPEISDPESQVKSLLDLSAIPEAKEDGTENEAKTKRDAAKSNDAMINDVTKFMASSSPLFCQILAEPLIDMSDERWCTFCRKVLYILYIIL